MSLVYPVFLFLLRIKNFDLPADFIVAIVPVVHTKTDCITKENLIQIAMKNRSFNPFEVHFDLRLKHVQQQQACV